MGGCASTGAARRLSHNSQKSWHPLYFWELTHFSALHRQSFIPKNTWIFGNSQNSWHTLFLGITPLFGVVTSIVRSQKYPDFWEFPKFMTHPIFGKSLTFRRCNVDSSFPKIVGFLGIPKIHDTPSIFGNYLTFHRCNVNSSFPKILGFLGMNLYFWETKRKKDWTTKLIIYIFI